MRQNKISSPSIPVNNRAFMECDEAEFVVVGAVQAIHWVLDPETEAGIDMLCKALPKVARRTIERAAASLKKRGILIMLKGYGKPARFGISLQDFSFKEFRDILQNRQLGGNGDDLQSRQDGGDKTANVAETIRQDGGFNIKNRLKDETKRETGGFDLFWTLCSKKTTKSESFEYWTKTLKPSQELQAVILAGLTLENQCRAAVEAKGQFFPAPADPIRWLKKRRWEDEHTLPGQATACNHSAEKITWGKQYADGTQVGKCRCGAPQNRMVKT